MQISNCAVSPALTGVITARRLQLGGSPQWAAAAAATTAAAAAAAAG